jgi:ketosteroid isomerase-like protein
MSNVQTVRGFYDSVAAGDLEGALARLTPDCAWTEMDGFPYRGTHRGPDAIREGIFARLGVDWEDFRLDVDEVIDGGDTIVGVGTYSGTWKATGRPMRARVVHVWRLRDGKVHAFEQFTDTLRVADAMASR